MAAFNPGLQWADLPEISMLDPRFDAVGDGAADDTTAWALCVAACPAFGTIDLAGRSYSISAGAKLAEGVTLKNGELKLQSSAPQFSYCVTVSDYCKIFRVRFTGSGQVGSSGSPKYKGGVFGCNGTYSGYLSGNPASFVHIEACHFQDLTVGAYSGGASSDDVPVGWIITKNTFEDIVGFTGESEGYGVLFTPSNSGVISENIFLRTKRHAIYLAGEASGNTVRDNIIDTVDNVAIQQNTSAAQNTSTKNVYSGNHITNVTRTVSYGYLSSNGIGLYGKFAECVVENNFISDFLDTGITIEAAASTTAYGRGCIVKGNRIVCTASTVEGAIRASDIYAASIDSNQIELNGAVYGIVLISNYDTQNEPVSVCRNVLISSNSSAIAFRVALSASRHMYINRNDLYGFAEALVNRVYDSSSAGVVRTDLNNNAGYYGSDADFTHNAAGTAVNIDCPKIRHAATLTTSRSVTLAKVNVPVGASVTIMRPGAGAFVLNIVDGGVIKALSTGEWGRFFYNGAGWEIEALGSL